jgi:hypothetical protein
MASKCTPPLPAAALQESLIPPLESSEVAARYLVIQAEELSDPRPRYPVQLNIKLCRETASQIDALAERLHTPRSAVARCLLLRALGDRSPQQRLCELIC